MNARAVKKRLMRSRRNAFWGERAYLTVKLPCSVLEEPVLLKPCPDGFKADADWEGHWLSLDGTLAMHVSRSTTGMEPDPNDTEFFGPHETVASIEKDSWDGWTIWSGSCTRKVVHEDGTDDWEPCDVRVPVEFIQAYRAYYEWRERLHEPGMGSIMDAFNEAGNSAKSVDWQVDDKGVWVTYGVKWFYPYRKYRFCSDLAKALRLAHKEGKQGVIGRG